MCTKSPETVTVVGVAVHYTNSRYVSERLPLLLKDNRKATDNLSMILLT